MNSAAKRLINFRFEYRFERLQEAPKSCPCCPASGAHCRRFECFQNGVNTFLLFIFEREEREPRQAATLTALVHGVFHASDSALRDDELRSAQNRDLQLAGFLLLSLAH